MSHVCPVLGEAVFCGTAYLEDGPQLSGFVFNHDILDLDVSRACLGVHDAWGKTNSGS